MNIATLLIVTLPVFVLAYYIYARFIGKVLGEDPSRPTPAYRLADGSDYVPSKTPVLFAHHFSTIAGAGPIIGPTIALLYGVIPVWLWVVLGAIFIGAVHDFTTLFVSIREDGRSMAEIANRTLGKFGFFLFISFTIIMIVLVTSAFLALTVKALTSLVPLTVLGLESSQKILHTVTVAGVVKGKIGGIASTSVIVMTFFAPLFGYLLFQKKVKTRIMLPLAVVVAGFSIYAGIIFPVQVSETFWMILLSFYVFIAAGIPVWVILQPRDFINVQILYAGIFALMAAIIVGGFKGITLSAPGFNVAAANQSLGIIWPVLFITVACGAISGFHALVSGGTSSKQIQKETHAKIVGFGGMLLEAVLAVCVITAVAAGLKFIDYQNIVFPLNPRDSNPVLAFSLGMGLLLKQTLGIHQTIGTIFGILLLEGFIVTTLDTAVRLNRYLFEELWGIIFTQVPSLIKSYWFNAGLSVVLMFSLAYFNGYAAIWPIFGTGNQLLAALSLTAVSAWLLNKGKRYWFAIIPAIFMMLTTLASLILLLVTRYLPAQNFPLIAADILLLILAGGFVILAFREFFPNLRLGPTLEPATAVPLTATEEEEVSHLTDTLHD